LEQLRSIDAISKSRDKLKEENILFARVEGKNERLNASYTASILKLYALGQSRSGSHTVATHLHQTNLLHGVSLAE
jgi:hypothetical protein